MKTIKICFVVSNAYSLFDRSTNFEFGGAELRASIFAKEIAKNKDFKVYFITNNFNQFPYQNIDNVILLADRYNNASSHIKSAYTNFRNKLYNFWIRFSFKFEKGALTFNDYLKNYWLLKTKADYFFTFSMTHESLAVIDFCKNNNKKYIQFIASDEELNTDSQNKLGLKIENISDVINNATKIIVQNTTQKDLLFKNFSKESYLLKNPVVINKKFNPNPKNNLIIWVGKSNTIKQPEIFVELARINPDLNFCMVCSIGSSEIHSKVKNNLPVNLSFIERISLSDVENLISKAKVFVSTSLFEGFPNTFLQAANYGLPVLSLIVNPDNYLTKYKCGFVCSNDLNELSDKLNILLKDDTLYNQYSKNHFEYLKSNHDAEEVVNNLLDLIHSDI